MIEPVQTLHYAGKPRLRRKLTRRVVITIAAIAIFLCARQWGRPVWNQAVLLYWQHQCMIYQPPANAVRFESDPTRAAALIRSFPNDYAPAPFSHTSALLQARCLRNFDAAKLERRLLETGFGPLPPTVFLHGMRTPSGAERLVVIEWTSSRVSNLFAPELTLLCRIYEPAGLNSLPRRMDPEILANYIGPYFPAEFGVGTADASNPTHLTIFYSAQGQSGSIDGWLGDNNRIRFVVRDGPGK